MKYLLYTLLTLTLLITPQLAYRAWHQDWVLHAYNVYGLVGLCLLISAYWDGWRARGRR